jgi:hypothetical protein
VRDHGGCPAYTNESAVRSFCTFLSFLECKTARHYSILGMLVFARSLLILVRILLLFSCNSSILDVVPDHSPCFLCFSCILAAFSPLSNLSISQCLLLLAECMSMFVAVLYYSPLCHIVSLLCFSFFISSFPLSHSLAFTSLFSSSSSISLLYLLKGSSRVRRRLLAVVTDS